MTLRKKDYRLFTMHGLVQPRVGCEARIRNGLFVAGTLKLMFSRRPTDIRLVAYEMPLEVDVKRGDCLDLFGYDAEHNPYIIEIKRGKSPDEIPDVIKQINRYESKLIPLLGFIENEIKDKLFLREFKFSKQIKKIILAPAEYYTKHEWKDHQKEDVLFCYIREDKNVDAMCEFVTGEKGFVVYIYNKPKRRAQNK